MEWKRETPWPTMWKRMLPEFADQLYSDDLDDTIARCRKFWIACGWNFEPGDIAEIMINHTMRYLAPRTFCLSEKLTDALLNTTIDKVPTELIRLPFPSVYIDFSYCGIECELDKGELSEYRGVLLKEEVIKGIRCLGMHHIRHVPNAVSIMDTPYPFGFNAISYWMPKDSEFNLPDEVEMEGLTKEFKRLNEKAFGKGIFTKIDAPPKFGGMIKTTPDIIRLTINAILYINSANADVREEWLRKKTHQKWRQASGKRKTKLKKQLHEEGKVFRCGYAINIPGSPSETSSEKTDRKVKVRFEVRGHWRHYWIGSKRMDNRKRVLKWIMPHWKGPEMAEVIKDKFYQVDKKTKAEEG